VQLGEPGEGVGQGAALGEPGGLQAVQLHRGDVGEHAPQALLDDLEVVQRVPELAATAGVGERGVEPGDGVAKRHPGAEDAGGGEHPGGVGEGVRPRQPGVFGDPDASSAISACQTARSEALRSMRRAW
jgi:hypothetical protein